MIDTLIFLTVLFNHSNCGHDNVNVWLLSFIDIYVCKSNYSKSVRYRYTSDNVMIIMCLFRENIYMMYNEI